MKYVIPHLEVTKRRRHVFFSSHFSWKLKAYNFGGAGGSGTSFHWLGIAIDIYWPQ